MRRALQIIFELILYPFRLIYLVLALPVKIIFLIYKDAQQKGTQKKKQTTKLDTLEIGQLLFQNNKKEFQVFYNLYSADYEKFKPKYNTILKNYNNFDLENLKPIEILYIFGDNKKAINLIDWRGEENLYEIEDHIENQLNQKLDWTNTVNLRTGVDEELQTDGIFIIDLFKSVDNDLRTINQKLIFFDLGWDSYIFKTVDNLTFDKIISKSPDNFHGTDNLRK